MLVVIFLLSYLHNVASLIIYNSSIPIENDDVLIGLKYLKETNQVLDTKNGFTACVRFNYRKLDSYLFYFGEAKYSAFKFEILWHHYTDGLLLMLGIVRYMNGGKKIFGLPWFRDISGGEESSVSINKWNHLCISFGPSYSNYTLILVHV